MEDDKKLAWVVDEGGNVHADSEKLLREVDKAADNVVKHWFCDHRSANEGEFFVEYCDFGCWDLADLARKTGGWEDYNSWRSEGLFRPAWGRVWSRCIRLGLPWEDLGFVAPGV